MFECAELLVLVSCACRKGSVRGWGALLKARLFVQPISEVGVPVCLTCYNSNIHSHMLRNIG